MAVNNSIGSQQALKPTSAVTFAGITNNGDLDFDATSRAIGASLGANNLTIAGATSTVIIPGDLTVQGTTTQLDTTNLNIKDKNILINDGGSTAGTTGAGIDIEGDAAAVVGYMKVGAADNTIFEFNAPGNAFICTLDINATKTLTVGGALDIEADSVINQDLSTDSAVVSFAGITLTGDVTLTGQATDIDLIDNTASALSFDSADKAGIISISTIDGSEGVDFSGFVNIGATIDIVGVIDDDSMATASDTNLATSESIKAYIDSKTSIVWNEVTGTTQALAVENAYILNNVALVTATLPATAAVGDVIRIAGKGAGGWKIAQNALQTINFLDTPTTVGVTGYLQNTGVYDAIELVCITADTTFEVISSMGTITIA